MKARTKHAVALVCFLSVLIVVIFSIQSEEKGFEYPDVAGFVEIEQLEPKQEEPLISFNNDSTHSRSLSKQIHYNSNEVKEIQRLIEDALGIDVAAVRVILEEPLQQEVGVPWRIWDRLVVQISLPSSWITQRMRGIGAKEVVLKTLNETVTSVVPNSKTVFNIVQVPSSTAVLKGFQDSYAKQIVLLVGLFGILFASFIVDYRKPTHNSKELVRTLNPVKEANRILRMPHADAVLAIQALDEDQKILVLQSIVALESMDASEDQPVVHVLQQPEHAKHS